MSEVAMQKVGDRLLDKVEVLSAPPIGLTDASIHTGAPVAIVHWVIADLLLEANVPDAQSLGRHGCVA